MVRKALGAGMVIATFGTTPVAHGANTGPAGLPQQPVAYGTGGGAATMSPYATASAIEILRGGGNAVDAAVAAAATLGVSEPFVAGPGGGGYFVYFRAKDRRVFTIDGRETAPAGAAPTMFLNPDGTPQDFETTVESGESVGVPGNVATWGTALQRFGTRSIGDVLRPASRVARRGFRLDRALVSAIDKNRAKLSRFPASASFYLPGGRVPATGERLRNPDLATTYDQIGRRGWQWFYNGPIASEIAATVQRPPASAGTSPAAGGTMTAADLANYRVRLRAPATWTYRGFRFFGMAPSSSGGTTVGEAMNILATVNQAGGDRSDALFRYLEASKLAFADRGRFVGDPQFVKVPTRGLLSPGFGAERAKLLGATAAPTPVAPGDPFAFDGASTTRGSGAGGEGLPDQEQHTNHLVVADRAGNVVSYTNTIEQIAGSGITVRGFLLNNE